MTKPAKPTKEQQKRQKLLIAGGVIVLAIAAIAIFAAIQGGSGKQPSSSSVTPQPSSSPTSTPAATASVSPGSTATPNPSATPTPASSITAPLLSMSSGNNGPVPAGAVIEFVCRTTSQQSCGVTLTNTSGKTINLDAKTTQDDGRGVFGATWNWTSVSGEWSVVANAQKDGAKASSAKQEITVQ